MFSTKVTEEPLSIKRWLYDISSQKNGNFVYITHYLPFISPIFGPNFSVKNPCHFSGSFS
jgi:hypothetical protein